MEPRQSGTVNNTPSSRCFPSQLYAMLEQVENDGMAHIVSWRSHGCAFKVHRKDQFVESVLPRWFRQSTYNSFQRQLNIYGFRRFPEGRDKDSYFHEHFVRGQYEQTLRIDRNAVKGTRVRRPNHDATFPNFYNPPCDNVASNPSDTDGATTSQPSDNAHSELQNHPQFPFAPLRAQQSINSAFSVPNNGHYQRRDSAPDLLSDLISLQRHRVLQANLASANLNDNRRLLLNNAAHEMLPNILGLSHPSPSVPTGLSSLDRRTVESWLLQQLNLSRPPVLFESTIQTQILMNTLQQQRLNQQDQMPLFVDANSINPNNDRSHVVNAELLEFLRRRFNPNGAGL